jgi:hypothetical protein
LEGEKKDKNKPSPLKDIEVLLKGRKKYSFNEIPISSFLKILLIETPFKI